MARLFSAWFALLLFTASLGAQTPEPQSDLPQPDANGIYHLGNGIGVPKCVHMQPAETTDPARKLKTSGKALVSIVIEPDGTVGPAQIVRSVADAYSDKAAHEAALTLDQKAIDAVRTYRFEPTIVRGKAVPLELKIEVSFQFR